MLEGGLNSRDAQTYSTEHDFRERNEHLRRLALLEGGLKESSASDDIRLRLAFNPTLDQRPSQKVIEEFAQKLKKMPRHQEGGHFTGTYESVMTEVMRVAADDFDGSLKLPERFEGRSAPGWVFENYRGWTPRDFDFLFHLIGEDVFLPGTLEQIRYQAIEQQDTLEYDQERDLSVIFDITSPLKFRGFALERVLKKLEKDPVHLNAIKDEGEKREGGMRRPSESLNDEYRNYVDTTIRFIENKMNQTPNLEDAQDKIVHPFE